MIIHRAILLTVCAFVALPLCVSSAKADTVAPEIKAIEIDAGPGVDPNLVQQAVKLRVGDPCSDAAVDGLLSDLWKLGNIRAPEVERQPVAGGVKLIIRVRRPPVVDTVEFTGSVALDADVLLKQLPHPVGASTDKSGFDLDKRALEDFYRLKGYPLAVVGCRAEEKDGKWAVTYNVECGPPLTLGNVRFEGNESFDDDDLSAIMKTKPGGMLSEGRYDPYVFNADLAAIAEFYRSRGWLDAVVTHRLDYDATRERLFPVVVISEGERYRVEQLVILGAAVFSLPDVTRSFRLKQDDYFSQQLLDEDVDTLRKMYAEKGYVSAVIEKRVTVAEKGANVTVEVNVREEGPAARIERVEIRGNNVTKDHVIRRYITVLPGEPVDPSRFDAIRRRLLNTGLFSAPPEGGRDAVEVYMEDGSSPDNKNLIVEVCDDVRGRFTIGATWNSDLGPMALFEIVHYNFDFTDWPTDWQDLMAGTAFAGGGQQLTFRLAPGPTYSDSLLSWNNPSVADSDYSFGWSLYANKWAAERFDRAREGVTLTSGRSFLDDRLRITLTPGYERLTISNVDSDAAQDFRDAKGTHNRHYVTLAAAYDERDDVFDPARGYYVGVDLTNVGGFLGGDVDALKEKLHAGYYATLADSPRWGRHVLSLTGALGMMQSTGDDPVPFFERWSVGGIGENRLRGFEYGGIGPTDAKSGDHVGGEYMWVGSAEYTFPLYREILRGALFLDAGNLARRMGDMGWNNTRVTAGIGLRVRLFGRRLGPVSLDFGFPVKKASTDDTQAFSFSLGGSFQF